MITPSDKDIVRRRPPSFWQSTVEPASGLHPPLRGEHRADVCIVGAGYTGLWTAYELLGAAPDLEIVVLEAQTVGFGASGRNGGWVLGDLAGSHSEWVRRGGEAKAAAQGRAIRDTVDYIGDVVHAEGIECDFVRSGSLQVAQDALQRHRLEERLAAMRAQGLGPEDCVLLEPNQLTARVAVSGATGAIFDAHCARVQPARLAVGLARAAELRGAAIFELSPAKAIRPGAVVTAGGTVQARNIILATEAYSARLPGLRRAVLPMRSWMIVTEPIDARVWSTIGWAQQETLSDARNVYVYLQRTGDGRIAIGGRGKPYRYGSLTEAEEPIDPQVTAQLRERLIELFPQLAGVAVAASWSGVLGVTRNWTPGVHFDRATRIGWARGYVGEGVAASSLAGRTLRDLILDRPSELTSLPWVAPPGRNWEPEPLRWAGVNLMYKTLRLADAREGQSGRSSLLSVPGRIIGATR
jgi:glycine/D-amino acid oxidase-like deaminating enzyme